MSSVRYSYDVNDPAFVDNDYAELYDELRESIADAIPLDYSETHYGQNIHRVISLELERISAAMHVVKRNCFVHLADEDAIGVWEYTTGIPVDHADTLEQRRKYMQAKLTGRHIFFGYHFDAGLEALGGPIRKYIYDPKTAQASIKFREPLSEDELRKIVFYCEEVGPAHIHWQNVDSPGAGMDWTVSSDSEYSAPWLRSNPDQESVSDRDESYLHKRWTELTPDQRAAYVAAAVKDYEDKLKIDEGIEELIEIYGEDEISPGDPVRPDWMEIDWVNSPPVNFTDDDAPPRYDEYI